MIAATAESARSKASRSPAPAVPAEPEPVEVADAQWKDPVVKNGSSGRWEKDGKVDWNWLDLKTDLAMVKNGFGSWLLL